VSYPKETIVEDWSLHSIGNESGLDQIYIAKIILHEWINASHFDQAEPDPFSIHPFAMSN